MPQAPTSSRHLIAYVKSEKLVRLSTELQSALGVNDFVLAYRLLNDIDDLRRDLATYSLAMVAETG